MQTGERMARSEEMAEQAMAIEIAGEDADAPPSERAALVPVGASHRVELAAQDPVVHGDVGVGVGAAEETKERIVVGQVLQRAELQFTERDMGAVQVDRRHPGGVGGQIGEHVASAGGDSDHFVARTDVEGFHVHDRIFPDLG